MLIKDNCYCGRKITNCKFFDISECVNNRHSPVYEWRLLLRNKKRVLDDDLW